MYQTFRTTIGILLLLGVIALSGANAAEQGEQHPDATAPAAGMEMMGKGGGMPEMMGKGMGMMPEMMMGGKPCMDPASPSCRLHMMSGALSGRMPMDPGMMGHVMDREFFLDRADQLGLSAGQVEKLKALRNACRKDNIRTGAEARIVRLDLDELLSKDNWSVKEAEKLVRQMQTRDGDMLVRHLQAISDARKVLTAEQLRKAESGSRAGELNELFK